MNGKKICKILSVVMAIITLSVVLVSCGSGIEPIKGTEQELKVVGTVGGIDVLYEELRYLTLSHKYDMRQMYGKDMWKNPTEEHIDELNELVYSSICTNYALLLLCDDYSVEIDEKQAEEYAQYMVESQVKVLGSFDKYKQSLKDYYLTDNYVRFCYGIDFKSDALIKKLIEKKLILSDSSEDEFIEYTKNTENYARVIQVYTTSEADAQTMYNMLKSGKKMSDIIGSKYNEDYGDATGDGYYFSRGEKEKDYEDIVFDLSIGQVSQVFKSGTRYYIVQRLSAEEEYVEEHLDTLMQYYQYGRLNALVREKMETLTFEPNEYGKSIVLTEIE